MMLSRLWKPALLAILGTLMLAVSIYATIRFTVAPPAEIVVEELPPPGVDAYPLTLPIGYQVLAWLVVSVGAVTVLGLLGRVLLLYYLWRRWSQALRDDDIDYDSLSAAVPSTITVRLCGTTTLMIGVICTIALTLIIGISWTIITIISMDNDAGEQRILVGSNEQEKNGVTRFYFAAAEVSAPTVIRQGASNQIRLRIWLARGTGPVNCHPLAPDVLYKVGVTLAKSYSDHFRSRARRGRLTWQARATA